MKVVISENGNLELTNLAIIKLAKLKGLKITPYRNDDRLNYRRVDEEWIRKNPNKYVIWLFHDYGDVIPYAKINRVVNFPDYIDVNMKRNDPALVSVVDEMGDKAAHYCTLRIVEIPDNTEFYVTYNPHDDSETVHEMHRTWPENRKFGNHYIDQFYRIFN